MKALTHTGSAKIRVRLGLATKAERRRSRHDRSLDGMYYEPSLWPDKLGLPHAGELTGLDLKIKSIFMKLHVERIN